MILRGLKNTGLRIPKITQTTINTKRIPILSQKIKKRSTNP
jgi:hypothetical protein